MGKLAKFENLTPEEIIQRARLTVHERKEVELFVARGNPDLQFYPKDELLEKYLQGHDIFELLNIFKEYNCTFGGITYLKLTDHWDDKKKIFLKELEEEANLKLAQTKFASIKAVTGLLDSFYRKMTKGLEDFNKTGDINQLPPELRINTLSDYRSVVRLLGELSNLETNIDPKEDKRKSNKSVSINAKNVNFLDPRSTQKEESGDEETSIKSFDALKTLYEDTKE